MKLEVLAVPPSLNKVSRMHWRQQRDLHGVWKLLVRSQMPGIFLQPIVRMRVKITLFHSRFYDKDNAYGAVKPIVDGLRHWKLIFDDTAEYLDLSVEQQKCPHKRRHTVIELEAA
jgi:hypothetical protein